MPLAVSEGVLGVAGRDMLCGFARASLTLLTMYSNNIGQCLRQGVQYAGELIDTCFEK